jgi:undecaprenyl-diphosphatase
VQGVAEFLPISSSGHLAVLHHLVHPLPASQTAAIDVALHAGTLVAVVTYFWRDLVAMLVTLLRGEPSWERRWIFLLGLGTVPAAVLGLTVRAALVESFASMATVGFCFLVTATMLWVAQRAAARASRGPADVGALDAVVVGVFQAFALLPGISRAGSTITGGILSGVGRETAAKFSFLLGIPAILGAVASEAGNLDALGRSDLGALALGTVVAGVTGFLAIGALMRLVRAERLHYFSLYLWPLGAVVLGAALVEGW